MAPEAPFSGSVGPVFVEAHGIVVQSLGQSETYSCSNTDPLLCHPGQADSQFAHF